MASLLHGAHRLSQVSMLDSNFHASPAGDLVRQALRHGHTSMHASRTLDQHRHLFSLEPIIGFLRPLVGRNLDAIQGAVVGLLVQGASEEGVRQFGVEAGVAFLQRGRGRVQLSTVNGEESGNVEGWLPEIGGVADEFDVERWRWSVRTAVGMVPVRHFDR